MDNAVNLIPADDKMKAKLAKIEDEAGTSINLCYQCGKCTAGCPVAFAMDYPPRQIIRLLQLDMLNEALNAESIWNCATCETCSARCPRGVDIASLMDALRREALRQGINTNSKVSLFNKAFLTGIKNFGKTYEAGLLLQFNMTSKQFLKDAELGLPMMKRGKVGILPERVKARNDIKKIFARVEELGGND